MIIMIMSCGKNLTHLLHLCKTKLQVSSHAQIQRGKIQRGEVRTPLDFQGMGIKMVEHVHNPGTVVKLLIKPCKHDNAQASKFTQFLFANAKNGVFKQYRYMILYNT